MEYYNNKDEAKAMLYWSNKYMPKELIPQSQFFSKPDTPENINVVSTSTTNTLNWNAVLSAASYEIEIDGATINIGNSTTYTHESLAPNSQHTYRIRAINEAGQGDYSETITKTTAPAIPQNITVISTDRTIQLNWENVIDAEEYDLEVDGIILDNGSQIQYLHENLQPSSEHFYRVRARNIHGSGDWSPTIKKLTLPDIPKNINADILDQSIKLTWAQVDGTSSYEVKVNGSINENISTSEYLINTLQSDYEYVIQVRARNSEGTGNWSPEMLCKTMLSVPTQITTDITDQSIKLNWIPVEHAASYQVEVDGIIASDVKDAAFTHIDLKPNSQHQYRVRAMKDDNKSLWTELLTKITLPDIPTNITYHSNSKNVTINWAAVEGAKGYDLLVDGELVDNIIQTTYTHIELEPNTKHNYQIRAQGDGGNGYWSNSLSVITAPGVPNHITLEVSETSINMVWESVPAAESYDVEADGALFENIVKPEFILSNLQSNTRHQFRIRAKNINGIGDWSTLIEKLTLMAVPSNINTSVTDTLVELTWSAVQGATSYVIEADGATIENGNNTTYRHEALSPNSQHTYRVRAKSSENTSNWSEIMAKKTLPGVPQNVTAKETSYTLSYEWDSVPGAEIYEVEIDGNLIDNNTKISYLQSNLEPNTLHSFRVRARNDIGIGRWSEIIHVKSAAHIPVELTAISQSFENTVTWEGVEEAVKYEIEVDGQIVGESMSNSFTHKGLAANKTYIYRVRVLNEWGKSNWSESLSKTTAPDVPYVNQVMASSMNIKINWDKVASAEYYEIEIDGVIIDNDLNNTYEYTDLLPNTEHIYRLRTINQNGIGNWSELKKQQTAPPAVSNISGNVQSTSITLTWEEVEGAEGYDVEVLGAPYDNGKTTTFTHINLSPNTQRTYRVRAKNAHGIGDWSEIIVKITLPGKPTQIKAIADENTIHLAWDAIAGAKLYAVEVDGIVTNNIHETTYTAPNLESNTVHKFRVRSGNADGFGDWSEYVTVYTLPIAPTNISTEITENSILLGWQAIQGRAVYEIEVDGTLIDNGEATSYQHIGLEPNSAHSYRIRTKNGTNVSTWTEMVEKVTLPGKPENILLKPKSNQIQITWEAVAGAVIYEIEANNTILYSGPELTYIHENLSPSTSYSYRIRAVSASGKGGWSEVKSDETLLGSPTNIHTDVKSYEINIRWDKIIAASAYEIEVDGSIISIGTLNQYSHSGLLPNSTHVYRIRAIKNGVTGDFSQPIISTTLLQTPLNMKAISKANSIHISWDAVDDAEKYILEVDGSVIKSTGDTSFVYEGLLPNTLHYFRIRAVSVANSSDWSDKIEKYTAPEIPVNIKLTASKDTISVNWDPVNGAKSYEIDVDGEIISINETKYLHQGLEPNTQHVYRVRAKSDREYSEWSEPISTNTAPELIVELSADNLFNFVVVAPRALDGRQQSVVVNYNPDEVEVLDICAITTEIELTTGDIEGTDITVSTFEPGKIVFSMKDSSKNLVNSIKFRAKISNFSKINYKVQ